MLLPSVGPTGPAWQSLRIIHLYVIVLTGWFYAHGIVFVMPQMLEIWWQWGILGWSVPIQTLLFVCLFVSCKPIQIPNATRPCGVRRGWGAVSILFLDLSRTQVGLTSLNPQVFPAFGVDTSQPIKTTGFPQSTRDGFFSTEMKISLQGPTPSIDGQDILFGRTQVVTRIYPN